jgi:hypothetical protein
MVVIPEQVENQEKGGKHWVILEQVVYQEKVGKPVGHF